MKGMSEDQRLLVTVTAGAALVVFLVWWDRVWTKRAIQNTIMEAESIARDAATETGAE